MTVFLEAGALVRHRTETDWGLGQVQSVAGDRVTVNFEHAGKVVLRGNPPPLLVVDYDPS